MTELQRNERFRQHLQTNNVLRTVTGCTWKRRILDCKQGIAYCTDNHYSANGIRETVLEDELSWKGSDIQRPACCSGSVCNELHPSNCRVGTYTCNQHTSFPNETHADLDPDRNLPSYWINKRPAAIDVQTRGYAIRILHMNDPMIVVEWG